ncbi:DinB family protein [Hymenobacter daeguensis]
MQPATLIAKIDHTLVSAFDELNGWFAAPAALRAYRPERGGWTIDEILEHVTLTNHYLLILIEKGATKALKNLGNLDLATELASYHFEQNKLDQIGRHRAFPWIRPEHMEPKGARASAEVATALQQQLHQCQRVLARLPNGEGVLYRTTMTVNALGKIDVYELVYFLAKHAERHVTQIQQAAAEYRQQGA